MIDLLDSISVSPLWFPLLDPSLGDIFTLLANLEIPPSLWPPYYCKPVTHTRQFMIPTSQVERKYFSRFHEFRIMSKAQRKVFAAPGDKALNSLAGWCVDRNYILLHTDRFGYNHFLVGMNSEMQADVHEACFSSLTPDEQRVFFSRYFSS